MGGHSMTLILHKHITVFCENCDREWNIDTPYLDLIANLQDMVKKLLHETNNYPTIPNIQEFRDLGVVL